MLPTINYLWNIKSRFSATVFSLFVVIKINVVSFKDFKHIKGRHDVYLRSYLDRYIENTSFMWTEGIYFISMEYFKFRLIEFGSFDKTGVDKNCILVNSRMCHFCSSK